MAEEPVRGRQAAAAARKAAATGVAELATARAAVVGALVEATAAHAVATVVDVDVAGVDPRAKRVLLAVLPLPLQLQRAETVVVIRTLVDLAS